MVDPILDGTVRLVDCAANHFLGGTVEHRRDRLESELRSCPTEMRFQNLAHIHTTGNTEGIEHDLDWRAIFQERHIFYGQNLCDDALIAMTAGHLIANRNHSFGGNVDFDHLQDTTTQFIASFHTIELTITQIQSGLNSRVVPLVDFLERGNFLFVSDTADMGVELKLQSSFRQVLRVLFSSQWSTILI